MRLLLSVLLCIFLIPDWMGEARLPVLGGGARISASPVALDDADPARRSVGQLTYLGGVALHGSDSSFGGYSALRVEGDRVTLLSDSSGVLRFRLKSDWSLRDVGIAVLPGGPGGGWAKRDRDSESMTIDPRTGETWIGYESWNEIWRYDRGLTRVLGRSAPPAIATWPDNYGAEAMVRTADGGFIVIAESDPWPKGKGRAAFRFTGDPTKRPRDGYRFAYLPPKGYDVSDMAALPDGRLLVLNRRFDLPFAFSAALSIVDPAAIHPGAVVTGRVIATLAPPLIHENFEGVAVSRENGRTIVWLVSDDNQSILQRSYLLKFRLEPDTPTRAARR